MTTLSLRRGAVQILSLCLIVGGGLTGMAFVFGSSSSVAGDIAPAPAPMAPPDPDALRLVDSARVVALAGNNELARELLLQAADGLPLIRDWLRLRAASLTADSTRRADLYRDLRDSLAKSRRDVVEGRVLEAAGDLAGAAAAYERAGLTGPVLRLRWQASRDSASRQAMVDYAVGPGRADAAAFELLASMSGLAPDAALEAARAGAGAAPAAAAKLFEMAFRAGRGTSEDRMAWGGVLARLGRYREAEAQFARVPAASPLAGRSAYERGRALVRRGRLSAGRAVLQSIPVKYPHDTTASASALYLLADLSRDAGAVAEARRLWLRTAALYPTSSQAPRARFF
ncbi:MAG: tol-pal system YbgF family protein, partial [Gemmatimonadales bacterium]